MHKMILKTYNKLMNKMVFSKTMEMLLKLGNIKLVNNDKRRHYLVSLVLS